MDEIFNKEIARELILEVYPTATDDYIDTIWARCDGNPWNAGILSQLIGLAV